MLIRAFKNNCSESNWNMMKHYPTYIRGMYINNRIKIQRLIINEGTERDLPELRITSVNHPKRFRMESPLLKMVQNYIINMA